MDSFCIQCGTKLGPGGVCPACGYTARQTPAPQQPAPQQPVPQQPAPQQPAPQQPAYAPQQPAYAPQQPAYAPQQPAYAPQQPASRGKKKNPVLILAAVLAAALVIGVGGFFLGRALGLFGNAPGEGPATVVEDPIDRPAAEEYLSELGAVTGETPAKSAALQSESDAVREFNARGFSQMIPVTHYDADGKYLGDVEIAADGGDKHPVYEAYYLTGSGALWSVMLVGDSFYAVPVTYNADPYNWDVPHTLSETGRYVAYDGAKNAFFTVDPKTDAMTLKRIDRIDAETLDGLDVWEVSNL